jgi:hypothetical protein
MALDEVNEVTVEEMENLICQLPTVMKCAVSVNDWGAIEEIHVLTNLERNPKQIVRDVESALLARYHLKVDHKRISVAQIVPEGSTGDGQTSMTQGGRLKIHEYHLESDALNQTGLARVIFAWGESEADRVTGQWSGRYLPSQHYQIMAWAAVDAINHIPGLVGPIVLTECRTVTLANRSVVLVALSQYDRRRRETLLVGTAEDRGDSHGASVRAVLDAVNRKVAPFIGLEDVHARTY